MNLLSPHVPRIWGASSSKSGGMKNESPDSGSPSDRPRAAPLPPFTRLNTPLAIVSSGMPWYQMSSEESADLPVDGRLAGSALAGCCVMKNEGEDLMAHEGKMRGGEKGEYRRNQRSAWEITDALKHKTQE